MVGHVLSHYEVLEKLGEGGMGVVYKAHDSHLDRLVAIKVLPPESVADPERKRRFVQEAKAASALNHPSIVTIHDIDTAEGTTFIVMEYVKGKTLDRLIRGRAGSLGDTLRISVQIADALAAAHAAGIVHRDIKPGNIIVSESGQVKLLDFGLAKLTDPAESGDDAATRTLRSAITEEGAVVGTVAYMSPEQAEGKRVDARSDIFSFGSVLYEMTTGRRAFSGETKASTMAAILREDPRPASEVSSDTPLELQKIISRCLRKDPSRRYQNMADVKLALEEAKEESESGTATPARQVHRFRWLLIAVPAAVVAIAVALATVWALRRATVPPRPPAFTRVTSDNGLTTQPAISADGKLVAYASDRGGHGPPDIWVQQIAGGEPIQVTHDPAGAWAPSFSRDSSKIVFRSDREGGCIYWISTFGGPEHLVARRGRDPRFSPDATMIAIGSESDALIDEGVRIAPTAGGQAKRLAPDLGNTGHPIWSADGKYILVDGWKGQNEQGYDWWIVPVDGGSPHQANAAAALRPLPPTRPGDWKGQYVYFSSAVERQPPNLWRVRLAAKNWQVSGPPERLTSGAGEELAPSVAVLPGVLRLVFASEATKASIWQFPADTNAGRSTGPLQRVADDAERPVVSADGSKLAFKSVRSPRWEIWVKDLKTGTASALTTPGVLWYHHPVMSADGTTVVYNIREDLPTRPITTVDSAFRVRTPRLEPEKLADRCYVAESLSGDGNKLLFGSPISAQNAVFTAWALDIPSGKRWQVLTHPRWPLWGPRFSPDDRWIGFHAGAFSEFRAFIAPFREGAAAEEKDWISVSDAPAREVAWSPDGNMVYYVSGRDGFRCLWAQKLDRGTKRPLGAPIPVYHAHSVAHPIGGMSGEGVRPAIARGKILLTLREHTGNIWMADLPSR